MTSRTWFLVKPERPWTKHHELFLYSDPSQHTRSGQGPTYHVKLSETSPEASVRTSTTQRHPPRTPTPPRVVPHEDGELPIIVSLPRGARKPEVAESTPTPAAAPLSLSPRPTPSPEQAVDAAAPVQASSPSISPDVPSTIVKPESPPKLHVTTEEQPVASFEPLVDDPFKLRDPPHTAVSPPVPATIAHSATVPEGGLLWRSPPPHLQTTFAQSASAPGYTSPYTYFYLCRVIFSVICFVFQELL